MPLASGVGRNGQPRVAGYSVSASLGDKGMQWLFQSCHDLHPLAPSIRPAKQSQVQPIPDSLPGNVDLCHRGSDIDSLDLARIHDCLSVDDHRVDVLAVGGMH